MVDKRLGDGGGSGGGVIRVFGRKKTWGKINPVRGDPSEHLGNVEGWNRGDETLEDLEMGTFSK